MHDRFGTHLAWKVDLNGLDADVLGMRRHDGGGGEAMGRGVLGSRDAVELGRWKGGGGIRAREGRREGAE